MLTGDAVEQGETYVYGNYALCALFKMWLRMELRGGVLTYQSNSPSGTDKQNDVGLFTEKSKTSSQVTFFSLSMLK